MIPVNEPLFCGNEKKYLIECIDTGWISSEGPFVKKFEDEFAHYVGCEHGVAVCNGTAALEVSLAAAGVTRDDEVIMPSFTIISCALAALRVGATPVLVDVESETYNMDVSQVEGKITEKTKAVMPVHMYGHPVNMDPLLKVARNHGLKVVEDAAEVHGAEYKGKRCGGIGDVGSFSFYANKIVTTGEGGMVVTNDCEAAERARSYRNLAHNPEKRFLHKELGYNFRMTNLQAAVGLAQLECIDKFIEMKRKNAAEYTKRLSRIDGLKLPVEKKWAKNVYWMYTVELDEKLGVTAEEMMNLLKEKGVGTRSFFIGLHQQPCLRDLGLFDGESYPVTEHISRYGFYLPSGLALTDKQVNTVCESVEEVIGSLV
ncbi:MAG: DegT/DnrJ/EryC1/StrS family aminotransferase [Candidatus Altiarchaeota archaeon]